MSFSLRCYFLVPLLVGCGSGKTSVLVTVLAAPSLQVASLEATVTLAASNRSITQPFGGMGAPPRLPGTIVVELAPVATDVAVALLAVTSDGQTLRALQNTRSVPNEQIHLQVVLGAQADGGVGDGGSLDGPSLDSGTFDGGSPDGGPLDGASLDSRSFDGGIALDGSASDLASPDLMPVVFLARDTFQRPDQALWGTASDGQSWGTDANVSSAFSIAGSRGVISQVTSTAFHVDATLGPVASSFEVTLSVLVNNFSAANELDVRLRDSASGSYQVRVLADTIRIAQRVNGQFTDLTTVNLVSLPNVEYVIKASCQGSALSAKIWPANQSEPTSATITATDSTFASGLAGVSVRWNATATASFSQFVVRQLP